jgi:hypothetical protein
VSRQKVELAGEGLYDLADTRLESLLLVGDGELRWPEDPQKFPYVITGHPLGDC